MLKNFFRVAVRNLLKNRLYAGLNISGLAIGMAGGILALLLVFDQWSYDKFLPNLPGIHLILQNQTQGGVTYTFQATPGPLAAALRAEVPEIERAVRTSWTNQFLLRAGEKSTYERGIYAEPDFFNIFQFKPIQGDPVAALRDAGSIVITARTAAKFFGQENPIGKTLTLENQQDLKVAAVVEDVPKNSTVRFDVVIPFRQFELINSEWVNSSWGDNSLPTWVELGPKTDLAALNGKLNNFIQGKMTDAAAHIFAYPLSEWHLRNRFKEGKQDGGLIDMLWLLGMVGLFVLLIACVNFMNLATARSERRAREVGVRKVIGAERSLIVGQFLVEALVLTIVALLLSLVLVKLALPGFNQIFDREIVFDFSNWKIWSCILGLGLLTGLVAGSYPAFFLSGFKPVRVLKGELVTGHKSGAWLRKGLVTFQFVISIFLIISTMVIHQQVQHAQNRPLGYDAQNLISIPVRGDMNKGYDAFKNDLLKIPGVDGVTTGTHNLVQFGSNTAGIGWPGKTEDQDFLISITEVGYEYTRTTGMQLVEGRDFSPEYGADSMCCLLNETAVRRMGLKAPVVGTVISYDTTRTVIGVVKDFVYNDPFGVPAPMAMFLSKGGLNNMFVRLENNEHWRAQLDQVEHTAKAHFPNFPFEFTFVREDYQKNFEQLRSTGQMANVFGGLAIFIACLGLFGLSAFLAEKRTKEIGIRKVLGAEIFNLWFILSREFFQPVFLAILLAIPPAIWLMEKMLSHFDYRIELSWTVFAVAGIAAVLIAGLTVSFQGIKAALANPVKSIRNE